MDFLTCPNCSNKVDRNLIESDIPSDTLDTGTPIFLSGLKRHSNPHAISLRDVVKVSIKNKVIIIINFKIINSEKEKLSVIRKHIKANVTYNGQSIKMFDKYTPGFISVFIKINIKTKEKIKSDK